MKLVKKSIKKVDAGTESKKMDKALDLAQKASKMLSQAVKLFEKIDDEKLEEEGWEYGSAEQYVLDINDVIERLDEAGV